MTVPVDVAVAQARSALGAGDFRGALDLLAEAPESPEVLEARAEAAYGAGDLELSIGSWERLYSVQLDAGEPVAAARAAAVVALNLLCETGLMAPVRAWCGRARRLVADDPGPVQALLAVTGAYERILSGDPAAALGPARDAITLGDTYGVDPARALGRVAVARLTIHDGQVERGIELLDEVAVMLAGGEFDPLTTGNAYCELICVAQWIGRHDLAREWTAIMDRWRHGPAFGATHGRCRVHRAELLRVSGTTAEAESEALAACDELRPWMRREYGWPLVELGNVRLRAGDLDGAEAAYLEALDHAWSPQPGLALVRLAQGDPVAAGEMVRAEIDHPTDIPWKERPPFGDLRLAPLHAAAAEIAAATGDRDAAGGAADALSRILAEFPSDWLRAEVALARARVAVLEGAGAAAVAQAQQAVALWVELEAPYDAAVARLVLGDGYALLGNRAPARLAWTSAAAGFAGFGAPHRVAEAEHRLAGGEAAALPAAGLAPSVVGLHRGPDHWVLDVAGAQVLLPDLKGIGYLARLVSEPGRELSCVDLIGPDTVLAPGLAVLDAEAKAAYRRRLNEVEQDLAEAEADNDQARYELAERDRSYLLAELSAAVGLGGRDRTTGGSVERARTSVTRTLRYALARISEASPVVGGHLQRTIRTGSGCSYQPDPLAPVTWNIG